MPKELFKVEKPAGINRLRDSVQEDPAVWQDAFNMRFQHGSSKKIEGYEEGLGKALVEPEIIVPLRDDAGDYYWWAYVGKDELGVTKFYRITSSNSHVDVTPEELYEPLVDRGYQWTGDLMNGVPYLTKGVPYYYHEASGKFKIFENIPRGELNPPQESPDYDPNGGDPRVRFKAIRSYRNFMIGLDLDTDAYPGYFDTDPAVVPQQLWGPWPDGVQQTAIWWSHFVINKDIDPEDEFNQSGRWEDANSILNSGWNFLGGTGGAIVDGRVLRDSFFIYRERAVWQMTYVGGVQIFAFKEVFNDIGCLGLDCTLEVDGSHLVIGQSDIYRHNGVRKETVADGVVRRELFSNIHPGKVIDGELQAFSNNVFIAGDYKNKEAWICIPTADSETIIEEGNLNPTYLGKCNLAYVFNWSENTWSKRDLPWITSSTFTILSISEGDASWDATGEGGPVDGNDEVPFLEYIKDSNGDDIVDENGHKSPDYFVQGITWTQLDIEETWANSFFRYNPAEWGLVMTSASKNIFTQTPNSNLISFTNYDLNGYRDQGLWDANANIPDIANIPNKEAGDYWTVSVDGTTDLSGAGVDPNPPPDISDLASWSVNPPDGPADIVLYDDSLDYFEHTGFRKNPQLELVNNFEGEVEKTHMDMGERMITKFVSRIYPLIRNGIIDVWMGDSMALEEGIAWEYKGSFDSAKDEHLSVRVTGRYIHVKFIIPETSRAEIRGYWLEYDMIGRR